jgi:hypothetical protein
MRTLIWLMAGMSLTACGGSDNGGSSGSGGEAGGTATISGSLLNGGALAPPLTCTVRTYYNGLLDPNSPDYGAKSGVSTPVSVTAWPQSYELSGVTSLGASWYVGAQCDTNGDHAYDVGGWYPGATPALVKAPATSIDITIQP